MRTTLLPIRTETPEQRWQPALVQKAERSLRAHPGRATHPKGALRREDELNQWLARSAAIVGGEPVEE